MSKAIEHGVRLPDEVAFFVAKRIRSNVRELEGALRRIVANSRFTGREITLDFAREALSDLLAVQAKLVTPFPKQEQAADERERGGDQGDEAAPEQPLMMSLELGHGVPLGNRRAPSRSD